MLPGSIFVNIHVTLVEVIGLYTWWKLSKIEAFCTVSDVTCCIKCRQNAAVASYRRAAGVWDHVRVSLAPLDVSRHPQSSPRSTSKSNKTGLQYDMTQRAFNKKLSYRRGTARCVVSVEILPVATQQCRNYLYDKSWTEYQLSIIDPCDNIVL